MTTVMKKIDELVLSGRQAGAAGLVVSTSGNISVRLTRGRFAISASGVRLSQLSRRDICFSTVGSGAIQKTPVPSIEEPLHRAIYSERSDAGAVLHFQSPYATALACSKKTFPDLNVIPEIPVFIRKVQFIPFHVPGNAKLAEAVREAVRDPGCFMIILQNHGQIALGPDLEAVLRNAEFFEFACRIAHEGAPLKRIPRKVLETLRGLQKA